MRDINIVLEDFNEMGALYLDECYDDETERLVHERKVKHKIYYCNNNNPKNKDVYNPLSHYRKTLRKYLHEIYNNGR